MDNVKLDGLFPTPVLTVVRPEPYSQLEYDFVQNVDFYAGTNNSISINEDILDNPVMADLKKFFTQSLSIFTEKVYLATSEELDISISWVNAIKPRHQHLIHKHKNAIISGCYYFESTKDCPLVAVSPLEAYNNHDFSARNGSNHFNCEEWALPTEGNTLLVFPSWLQHKVTCNNTNSTRYSIAWNAWFKKDKHYGFRDVKTYIKT